MMAFREASSDNFRYPDHYPSPCLAASTIPPPDYLKKKLSFHAHRGFRFYRWFVPHHLLCVHHRAGSITEYLESFKLQLGSYSREVKVPFIRANRTSVRKGSFVVWTGIEPRGTRSFKPLLYLLSYHTIFLIRQEGGPPITPTSTPLNPDTKIRQII